MARFTGPVRFAYSGNVKAGLDLRGTARKHINQIGNPSRRRRGANGMFKVRYSDGTTIVVSKTSGVYQAHIYVPPKKVGKGKSPGAFVIYPYTGWVFPMYTDRKDEISNGFGGTHQPFYYQHRLETIQSRPYWLDTLHSYRQAVPTEYEIELMPVEKEGEDLHDPRQQDIIEGAPADDRLDVDKHYGTYSYWRNGEIVDGEWVKGDWHLHWLGGPNGGMPHQSAFSGFGMFQPARFIYVNGVKFTTPEPVMGGCVYHDSDTNSDWLVVSTWVFMEGAQQCLHDAKAFLYMTRLTVTDTGKPIGTNNGDVVTTTEMYNAITVGTPDPDELRYDWFPIDDDIIGFTIPYNAISKGAYASDCDVPSFDGQRYLTDVLGFRFNQSSTKFCYVAEIEGTTAQEFNEFDLSFIINNTDGYLIPDTFTKTLASSSYVNTTVSGWASRDDGAWHEQSQGKIMVSLVYKEDVLQKLQCDIQVKIIVDGEGDSTAEYLNRTWYLNGTSIATQTLTTNGYDGDVISSSGDYLSYYNVETGDYVIENHTMTYDDVTHEYTYKKTIVVEGITISVDEGILTTGISGLGFEPGWPQDDFSWTAGEPNGFLNWRFQLYVLSGFHYLGRPTDGFYTDRVWISYFYGGVTCAGDLTVHRGHEGEHIMGTYVARSLNAGPNGVYYYDSLDPEVYDFHDTDHRWRVRQHMFVLNLNNADRLYSEFGVREDTDNHTLPLISTSFYKKRGEVKEH